MPTSDNITTNSITDDILHKVDIDRKLSPAPTFKSLAQKYLGDGIKEKELRDAYNIWKRKSSFIIPQTPSTLPDPLQSIHRDAIHTHYEPTLIIADLHAPHADIELLEFAVAEAKKYEVNRFVVAGDLFDAAQLSNYTKPWERTTPIELDITHGYQYMRYLLDTFLYGYFLTGNHDEWVMRQYGIDVYELFPQHLFPTLTVTQYPYMYMGKNILIGHLEQYNSNPGLLAMYLADKYKKNVFVGHDHIVGYKENSEGHNGVSIGGMLLADNIYYKKASLNDLPFWENGFVILHNNEARLYREQTHYRTLDYVY